VILFDRIFNPNISFSSTSAKFDCSLSNLGSSQPFSDDFENLVVSGLDELLFEKIYSVDVLIYNWFGKPLDEICCTSTGDISLMPFV
jgi:hypothetical protein